MTARRGRGFHEQQVSVRLSREAQGFPLFEINQMLGLITRDIPRSGRKNADRSQRYSIRACNNRRNRMAVGFPRLEHVMYLPHPSKALNDAFSLKPYQGAPPAEATYLFVGLDANYGQEIERSPIFPSLLQYLEDGAGFWKTYGIHHPFLLPAYGRGDGWMYHFTFSKIGFQPEHANTVSFVELVDRPTFGRSKLNVTDLSKEHLRRLNDVILHGSARHIFIPNSVARCMRESSIFDWLPKVAENEKQGLKVWKCFESKTIYSHYHFSAYGKFEQEKRRQLQVIGALFKNEVRN